MKYYSLYSSSDPLSNEMIPESMINRMLIDLLDNCETFELRFNGNYIQT